MKRILRREVLDPVLHRGHVGGTAGEGFFGWRLPDPGPGIMVVPAFRDRVLDVVPVVVGMRRPPVPDRHRWVRWFVVPIDEVRSEEHTSELQSRSDLVCRLLLEKK